MFKYLFKYILFLNFLREKNIRILYIITNLFEEKICLVEIMIDSNTGAKIIPELEIF